MFIKKETPAQRLVAVIQKAFKISIKLTVTEVTLLNRLSSKDTRHFLSLIEKLRLFDPPVIGTQNLSVSTIHAVIGLLGKYPLKVIQTVFNALNYYNLLEFGYLTHFVDLMHSFKEDSHRQHFIKIFNTHAYAPVVLMQRPSSIYRKEETLKPLLLLKAHGHALQLIEHLFKKIAHTRYVEYHRHELFTLDFDSLRYTLAIVNLLDPLKLVNDHNLRSILQHSRLAQNTNHSLDGLKVQLKLLSALRYSKLLTQYNIDQLNAVKLSASRLRRPLKSNDLNSPVFYFIPVILDWSAHEILTQAMLSVIFLNVKSALNEEDVLPNPSEANLIQITLGKVLYNQAERTYLTTAFFEGSSPTFDQISASVFNNPIQRSP